MIDFGIVNLQALHKWISQSPKKSILLSIP